MKFEWKQNTGIYVLLLIVNQILTICYFAILVTNHWTGSLIITSIVFMGIIFLDFALGEEIITIKSENGQ